MHLLLKQLSGGGHRWDPGADPGGGFTFTFRLYLINMLSIIIKFCLSIII